MNTNHTNINNCKSACYTIFRKYKRSATVFTCFLLLLGACKQSTTNCPGEGNFSSDSKITSNSQILYVNDSIDIEGHRGCRGLYPENTIAGFIKALQLGVTTLEMDIVVSKDNKLVVSHEPWLRAEICQCNCNTEIDTLNEKQFNIYQLTYDSIKKFDCGTKYTKRFPQQEKIAEHKPLLRDVILKTVEYCVNNNRPIPFYNMEIKTTVEEDNLFHPTPQVVAQLLYDELRKLRLLKNTIIQSFDVRALQAMKRIDSNVSLSLLVENNLSFEQNLAQLQFMPQIYSCDYTFVTQDLVTKAHSKGIKIVPWTVNDTASMGKLIRYKVDGIITDYPNMLQHKKQN